nr:MAG TPA: hypothetical protein [Caudoviricetes sp.]
MRAPFFIAGESHGDFFQLDPAEDLHASLLCGSGQLGREHHDR